MENLESTGGGLWGCPKLAALAVCASSCGSKKVPPALSGPHFPPREFYRDETYCVKGLCALCDMCAGKFYF